MKLDEVQRTIFEAEQAMLPLEERSCRICKGSRVMLFYNKNSKRPSEIDCRECGGTGLLKHEKRVTIEAPADGYPFSRGGAPLIFCPGCGSTMLHRISRSRDPRDAGDVRTDKHFLGCTNYPKCTEAHPCDRDGNPIGAVVSKETKRARVLAHRVLDVTWKQHLFDKTASSKRNRKLAYQWIRKVMNVSYEEGHIAQFDGQQCMDLVHLLIEKFGDTDAKQNLDATVEKVKVELTKLGIW